MSARPSDVELKITVAKLLELAYRSNKGITVNLLKQAGGFRIAVDSRGIAVITGRAGAFTFSSEEAFNTFGLAVKSASIEFHSDGENFVGYRGTINLALFTLTVDGRFDVEQLILACSGLLCRAARALKGRSLLYERQLLEAAR